MKTTAKRALWMAAVAALAAGCVVENSGAEGDGGADTDTDTDSDTDSDADGGDDDAGTYLACDGDDDICRYSDDGDEIEVVVDCPDQNAVCVEPDGGAPECQCVDHFALEADCSDCEIGWGGAACAVCEIGYGGAECGECVGAYSLADGECAYGGFCGSDSLWLDDGALPGTSRPDGDFAVGGTIAEPTTIDLVTGLEWQRCPTGTAADGDACTGGLPEEVAHGTALAHCLSPFGGHGDWRLPEASEIQSLFDFEVAAHVNETWLPYHDGEVWSATEVPGSGGEYYAVRLTNLASAAPEDGLAFGFCVRDVEVLEPPAPRFALGAADGSTVVDLWTDREWRRCIYGQTWEGAACDGDWKPYEPYGVAPADDDVACDDAFGGHADWRVPDAAEMLGLLAWCAEDRPYFLEAFSAALASEPFGGVYWTSTFDPEELDFYTFDFTIRSPVIWPVALPLPVLCVRDPG